MSRSSVYKICDTNDEGKEAYLKSKIVYETLLKLINVWQIRLLNLSETMAFCVDEIVEILESFGCERIENDGSFKSYWNVDIFDVWEAGCSTKCVYFFTDDDANNFNYYYNEKANEIMMRVFNDTNDYYEKEYGIRDNIKQ